MLCITVAKDDKWANVIAAKVIGASKHIDYALFHWKAKDVKALKLPLSKFIFVSAAGVVDEVILADQLAARGSNFKTAKRDSHPLTEEEQWEIDAAIELVRTGAATSAQPGNEPGSDGSPAGEPATAEVAGTQAPVVASAQSSETESEQAVAFTPAPLDNAQAAGRTGDQSHAERSANANANANAETEAEVGGDQPASLKAALSTVKPSRVSNKKHRR